jgi:pyruvate dehydrogenase E2 component (dihydrolipoamide acetyltransferase)
MAYTVQMPALGESVTEGTITRWLKQVGDHVEVDEPLLEVSTDKVDTEIPAPQAGFLQRIVADEDDTVEIGGDLAVIGDESEGTGDGGQESSGQEPAPAESSQPSQPEPSEASQPEPAQPEPAAASSGGGASSGGSGTEIEMPALGESVTEGTITRWLKQVGDTVEVDEPLLEVSTDKVDTEIPSPVAGTLLEVRAQEDDTVEVGGVLAVVGSGSPSAGGGSSSGGGGGGAQQQVAEPEPEQSQPAQSQSAQSQPAQSRSEPGGNSGTTSDGAIAASGADDYVSHETEQPAGPSGPANAGALRSQQSGGTATRENGNGQGASDQAPYVTPLVRKLAAERGVDLSAVSGTGVGGRIRKQDVVAAADEQDEQRAAASKAPSSPASDQVAAPSGGSGPGAVHGGEVQKPSGAGAAIPQPDESGLRGTTQKLSRRRATIAKRMVESLQTSAQLTTVVEADLTRIARLRDRAKEDFARREGVKLSFLPFMALATVEALKAHPGVNASIDTEKGQVTYHGAEHLGIAVDSPAGLIVPVIHDAGDLNLGGLARRISDVADRTRSNKIAPDELSGGTFTITNTGSRGALIDTPIINQPQVAILGTGAVVKKPVVVTDGEGGESIAIRSMAYLCLSYDHRIVDGADAARFLGSMKARLEAGAFEADLGL